MLKRDNWTNEEVIDILEGFQSLKEENRSVMLDSVIDQFYDFKRDQDEFAAMAYDTEKKEILVIGPELPR